MTQFFLYPPLQTPVGRPTSYQVHQVIQVYQVRISRQQHNSSIAVVISERLYHCNMFSILPHEHLWGGLCNVRQVKKVRVPRGLATCKSNYTCTLPSYVCALTHFLPLLPMTTCGVIQVHQVRIFRELRTYTHSAILNTLCECVTQFFLFSPSQTPVRWAM